MFTGIVEEAGRVVQIEPQPPGVRLVVQAQVAAEGTKLGDSICVAGCCLTVVEIAERQLSFEAGEETLSRTSLGRLQTGDRVNLERSLQLESRLGGHLVTGHIDAAGTLDQRTDDGDWSTLWFRFPANLGGQIASKGSIAIDGVSLTVVDVEPERFSVALIPHTLEVTTLGELAVGDPANLETDLLAKYVQKQLAFRHEA